VSPHIQFYKDNGLSYRWDFTFKDFSAGFGATPMASYFATLFTERDAFADLPTILTQLAASRPAEEFFQTRPRGTDQPMLLYSHECRSKTG
jgi:hypothetical protein